MRKNSLILCCLGRDVFANIVFLYYLIITTIQMVQRVTYRRRLSYNTQSNRVRKVRTPGSRVVVQYVQKRGHGPRAGSHSFSSGERINGIAQLRPYHYKRLAKKDKTVSRPYGGVLSGQAVKSRIIRAFLLEEIRTIKRAKQASKK